MAAAASGSRGGCSTHDTRTTLVLGAPAVCDLMSTGASLGSVSAAAGAVPLVSRED